MFPKPPWFREWLKHLGWNWNPGVYGNIQQTFYADLTDRIAIKPSIWEDDKERMYRYKEEVVTPKNFMYFVIKTSVAVGAKGSNNVRRVHIRFRLIPMNPESREPEVVSIYPYSISLLAGERHHREETRKHASLNVGSNVQVPVPPPINIRAGGEAGLDKNFSDESDWKLPYHVTVANASGTGNRAMWEFYQEKGMAAMGQFDLKIFFRIPSKDLPAWEDDDILKHLYFVDWNVEVNGKRLIDHKIDFEGNWNMKVNGRRLMDRKGNMEYEENPKMSFCARLRQGFRSKYLEPKYKEEWNVPVQDISQEMDKNKIIREKKHRRQIYNMMNEEDPKSEPLKLLRPLYLTRDPDT